MAPRVRVGGVWVVWLAVAAAWVVTRLGLPAEHARDAVVWQGAMLLYGAVGALIISKRRGNRVGLLFFAIGTFDVVAGVARNVALTPTVAPGVVAGAAWLQTWIWSPALCGIVLLIFVFPAGVAPGGAWRWGPRLALLATAVWIVPIPVLFWPHRGPAMLGDAPAPGIGGALSMLAFLALGLTLIAAVLSMAVRLRRAVGI